MNSVRNVSSIFSRISRCTGSIANMRCTTSRAKSSGNAANTCAACPGAIFDKIENINGTRVQPGGAALYSAMAARTLSTNVALISAVGKDYDFPNALNLVDSEGVKTYNMPSTRFHIKYNKRWEARYLKAIHGAGSKITSKKISQRLLGSKSKLWLIRI